jgi:hypothetical protein
VATPNIKQNKALSDLLSWSICPDLTGDKWILYYITYNLDSSDNNKVNSVFVAFIDKTSKYYQFYLIDLIGNLTRSKFDV